VLKLDIKNPEDLKTSLAHEGATLADIENLIDDVKKGRGRILSSENADGVIEILTEDGQNEMFLRAWGGKNMTEYLKDLINFAKNNRLNALRIQTKSKSVFSIITNRYGFKPVGFINENFVMRRAF